MFATILALYASKSGKVVCGEKTPQHLRHAERMLKEFPNSSVFCLVRDGRDTSLSLDAMPWWPSDLRAAAQHWLDSIEQARSLSANHPERFVIVRYEQLVTKPEEALRAILNRLGLDFEPQQLIASDLEATKVILPRSRAWKSGAAGPIDSQSIGLRRANASKEDIALLDQMLGATLESLGYDYIKPDQPISNGDSSPSPSTENGAKREDSDFLSQKPAQEFARPEIARSTIIVAERPRPFCLDRTGISTTHSPRLTVSIMTSNSASRLARLIDEVSCFADEIVVGVDTASSDETLEIACDLADKVYRFDHPPGQLSGARMLIFRYASGDWILSLDDDESISDSFDEILPELLSDPTVTNFWFVRQWIVDRGSFTYLHKPPWYPDWQLRLFRNDASLVSKPARAHSGYYVQGVSRRESRAVIHHFEPVLLDVEARARKLAMYRAGGSVDASELQYASLAEKGPRASASQRCGIAPRPRCQSFAVVASEIQMPQIRNTADWGCRILGVEMSPMLKAAEDFVAGVWARNIGFQAWMPDNLSLRGPLIRLSYHVLTSDGDMLKWDTTRSSVPKLVRPGETVMVILQDRAPAERGSYIFEWDFVCELEAWFGEVGSTTYRTLVEVM